MFKNYKSKNRLTKTIKSSLIGTVMEDSYDSLLSFQNFRKQTILKSGKLKNCSKRKLR